MFFIDIVLILALFIIVSITIGIDIALAPVALEKPRETRLPKTYQIERDAKRFELYTFPQYKYHRLVFNKRVVDPATFKTYPYWYYDLDTGNRLNECK